MDTIAAISTPLGKGGVALIRISGSNAFAITEKVFQTKSAKPYRPRHAYYGVFSDHAGEFDDGIVTFFQAGNSFTGEDTAELCCHGGVLVTNRLLRAVIAAGASYAAAGEFTKRAFLNGNLTLTEAEAIGSLLEAKTDSMLAVSHLQSGGALSARIKDFLDRLSFLSASVYAYIDYPDEDLADLNSDEMKSLLIALRDEMRKLIATSTYGKAISEGVQTVLIGRPNTGKSSLLNALAGFDRAIVTEIPGTTRDIVSEQVTLGGILLNLADTAGIRTSDDTIEAIGIQRSLDALANAELVFCVLDATQPLCEEDNDLLQRINSSGKTNRTICLLNKSDLKNTQIALPPFIKHSINCSAKTGEGLEELANLVADLFGAGEIDSLGEVIVNARQLGGLESALQAIERALDALQYFTPDVASHDIEEAISRLGELDGRSVSELIVNQIFSHFCVGK